MAHAVAARYTNIRRRLPSQEGWQVHSAARLPHAIHTYPIPYPLFSLFASPPPYTRRLLRFGHRPTRRLALTNRDCSVHTALSAEAASSLHPTIPAPPRPISGPTICGLRLDSSPSSTVHQTIFLETTAILRVGLQIQQGSQTGPCPFQVQGHTKRPYRRPPPLLYL